MANSLVGKHSPILKSIFEKRKKSKRTNISKVDNILALHIIAGFGSSGMSIENTIGTIITGTRIFLKIVAGTVKIEKTVK